MGGKSPNWILGGKIIFTFLLGAAKNFAALLQLLRKKNKSPLEASFPERRHHELHPGTFRDFLTKRKKMGLTAAAVGGLLGFSAQCMSNAIQKIPLSRRKSENFGEKDGLFPFFKSEILILVGLFSLFSLLGCGVEEFRTMDACDVYSRWSLGCKQMVQVWSGLA